MPCKKFVKKSSFSTATKKTAFNDEILYETFNPSWSQLQNMQTFFPLHHNICSDMAYYNCTREKYAVILFIS